ncbi:asparagine synthase (glutamine-hydrolyzing) [Segetibacter aerophilus]|uniref:asparagine synthase (glutamine-hydrolyzing) n=1 Tax=Segetibacter aerophilus TaxID=670293 RepID=A0A512BDA2_9BACT|nr:asparagine synthase (glutamine-hydrolyzing) [Segetibacter aerophilus]GEO09939.1 asparagine synthetase B [Segetibacter aerophilus]
MCGIVGIFNYRDSIEGERPFIEWALKSMHHRGPDSNGTWTNNENYITGFVRLSILDLSENGNQPMISACGKYALSFNGEMYDVGKYRKRLQNEGVTFRSTTDTEVLLYALIHWGEEYVLEQFDGLFAFAFYNVVANSLILARDRSGIKPLYVGHSSQGLVYSSQYDHIINHHSIKSNPLHTGAVGAYLSLGYVPENSGVVTSTFLLPHGYYLHVNSAGFTRHRFFNYSLLQKGKAAKSLEQVLEENVRAQLVSDVPVGTFMSGGVDSPLVSYYANKHTNIQSFTIGVDDKKIDESKAAEEYANIFHTQHFCQHITEKDLLETIADNTKAFSEPFADFSSIPTLVLSKFARQKVIVALSGDGGDELFWGYPRNQRMLREGMAFRQNKLERVLSFGREKVTGAKRIIRRRHLQVRNFPAYYYRSLFITGAEQWLPELFDNEIEEAFFLKKLYEEEGAQDVTEQNIMNVLRKLEFDIHLQRILLKVDRASMFHSLEVRVPILSNEMIDYSSTMNFESCIKNGQGKYNLKQLLISKSNEQLVLQPKKGFVIPIGNWLRKELKKDVEDKIMNMPGELSHLFERRELEKILNEHNESKQDLGWLIWSLYSLVNWHHQHRKAI